jgi:DNA repair exonuclease SbcCD nuclease subunit
MSNLFKKVAVMTDIHFGLKGNSQAHNEDCLAFVDWVIKTGQEHGCETAMFLGDWHNNRASINIATLNYSLTALERLSQSFDRVLFIPGNHDLYYKDRRDIQSAEWAKHIPNIEIVNDFFLEGDVSIVPWLVGDDHKRIPKINARYMFGHFELPGYMMNAMVQMPEHGEIRREHFGHIGHVFSGHFHKRQTGKNITYIGNAFPHNYADAGDDERGMMVLKWGQDPEFYSWPGQPTFRVYNLSEVLDRADTLLKPDMHVRVNLDINISYEEANFIKETFGNTYNLREITLIPRKNTDIAQETSAGNIEFKSVDQIVIAQLNEITSEHFDTKLLLEIYRGL